MSEDKRPDPKPRKNIKLWQAYLYWSELDKMRKTHILRLSSITKGKSTMNAGFEEMLIPGLEANTNAAIKEMINFGEEAGPIWDWLRGIKGLKNGKLTAQLVAQIDDPARFATIAKLWRFAGYGITDGKRDTRAAGEKSLFNGRLKGVCYNIADQFIRQSTPFYSDIYYSEKKRLRELYPDEISQGKGKPKKYTDMHIHMMARRKMMKRFLKDLWIQWRIFEGLPLTEPHAEDNVTNRAV